MAKMFYTLEEAAQRLGMSVDDVKALTESGQLSEFRDQDKVMLKVEQVDLLAGDQDDDDEMIPLADSGEIEPISLASSDSGPAISADPDQTGVSIFDPEEEEDVDPAAATQVSPSLGGIADFGEASGSGSGLANLALEGDDTSLGADLLEDVYSSTGSGSGEAESSSLGASGIADTGGDLFESAGTETAAIAAAPAMAGGPAAAEVYEGGWSGIIAGMAIGMVVTLALATTVLILMLDANQTLMDQMSMNFVYITVGSGLAVMVFGALIGWFLLRRS